MGFVCARKELLNVLEKVIDVLLEFASKVF